MSLTIEPLRYNDSCAIAELIKQPKGFLFAPGKGEFWSSHDLGIWFCSSLDVLLGAKRGDEIVGFSLASVHRTTRQVAWECLFLQKPDWGENAGDLDALVDATIATLRERRAGRVGLIATPEAPDALLHRLGYAITVGAGCIPMTA